MGKEKQCADLVWLISPMVIPFNDLFENHHLSFVFHFQPWIFSWHVGKPGRKEIKQTWAGNFATCSCKFVTPSLFLSRDAMIRRHSVRNCWQILQAALFRPANDPGPQTIPGPGMMSRNDTAKKNRNCMDSMKRRWIYEEATRSSLYFLERSLQFSATTTATNLYFPSH